MTYRQYNSQRTFYFSWFLCATKRRIYCTTSRQTHDTNESFSYSTLSKPISTCQTHFQWETTELRRIFADVSKIFASERLFLENGCENFGDDVDASRGRCGDASKTPTQTRSWCAMKSIDKTISDGMENVIRVTSIFLCKVEEYLSGNLLESKSIMYSRVWDSFLWYER